MSQDDPPRDRRDTPRRALNALMDLLSGVVKDLTAVELYAGRGRFSARLLQEGAARAVCVDPDPPPDRRERDGMIWLTMDPLEFFREPRVEEVGLVYSRPPFDRGLNREVLDRLAGASNLQPRCLILLEEPAWNPTRLEDDASLELIDEIRIDDVRIAVTQRVPPGDS